MITLALDTTTRIATSALLSGGEIAGEWVGEAALSPAAQLPRGLELALASAGCRLADVDLMAVAVGPGSFTGLRVGIATMQGLAFARGRPLVGISALEALAARAAEEAGAAETRLVAPWVDAWRGEVYAASYRAGRLVADPVVAAPLEILAAFDEAVLFTGDGAAAHRALIVSRLGERAAFAPTLTPRLAPVVARLAARRADGGERPSPHAIAPLYVRRPDAELARDSAPGPRAGAPGAHRAG